MTKLPKMLIRICFSALILLSASSLFWSCSKVDSTSASDATFSSIYTKSFTSCSNCHTSGGGSSGVTNLDMSTADSAYRDLYNQLGNSPSNPSQCAGVRRVVPSQASNSLLMAVLFSDYSSSSFSGIAGCTPTNIHYGTVSLSSTEKDNILKWIQAGASR